MEIESLSRRLLSLSLYLSSPLFLFLPLSLSLFLSLSVSAALPWRPLWHSLFHLHRHSTFSSSRTLPLSTLLGYHHRPPRRRTASTSPPVRLATLCLPPPLPPPPPPLPHPCYPLLASPQPPPTYIPSSHTRQQTPECVPHLSNDLLLMLYQLNPANRHDARNSTGWLLAFCECIYARVCTRVYARTSE